MNVQVKERLDRIFKQLGNHTHSIWVGGKFREYSEDLLYSSYILGQKVDINTSFFQGRIKAKLFIGEYGKHKQFFYKEISFTLEKSEKKIIDDLLYRLELSTIEEKVKAILEEKENEKSRNNDHRYLIELFKRFLPFEQDYFGSGLHCVIDGVRIELSTLGNTFIKIDADVDFLLKICSIISRDFVKLENKAV